MTTVPAALLAAAAALGAGGSAHCVAMCGGIAAAVGSHLPAPGGAARRPLEALLFNMGRVATYAMLGAAAGAASGALLDLLPERPLAVATRLLAAALMAVIALQLLLRRDLLGLERLGHAVWRSVAPLTRGALRLPGAARLGGLGLAWGFLPCGLVYSALALAATAGSGAGGAAVMLAFGVGTFPSMVTATLGGAALSRLLAGPRARIAAGLLMLVFAVWTAVGPSAMQAMHGRTHGETTPVTGHEHHHPTN